MLVFERYLQLFAKATALVCKIGVLWFQILKNDIKRFTPKFIFYENKIQADS